MTITEQVKKILNGEKVEESQGIEKAGLPVGTISGNYKKIADNPSKWEYLTQEQVFKNESGNERRAFLANKAPLITDIQELPCNEKNYKSVGTAFLYKMRNEVFTRDVICKANNKKVVDVNTSHIFKDKNTDENKTLRVRALPFVLPIIEKYGKRGLVTKRPDGIFTEVVGKADITVKGKKRRCAIAAVLVTNKKDRQALTQLSVFIVDNKVIKSLATDAPCVNRFVRSGLKNPCASNPHFSVHNSNITPLNNTVNRSINISISDITEGNRKAKYEQLEKCLSGGIPEYIPADNTPRLGTINIKLKDYSSERIEKALRTMAMSLSVPLKAAKGEIFFYKAQEDLTDKWCMFFSELVRNTYDYVTDYLDLPKKTVMSKSDVLTHKGKILYNPSTGEPIKQSDWNKFVGNLEKFLNRNIKDVEKKIILESKSLSKILDRMLKYNTLEAVKKLRLEGLQYHGKSFDWISENVKNMQNVFGESLTRQEQARIEVMTQSAAQKVTNISDKMRGDIKQILIDGVSRKKSKGQVSQALFDKMVGDNRDFQRVADTEIQNAFNNSFVLEEVYNTEEGKKTYFKRIEVIDGNTCPKCKAINGKIVVWSDKPLNDEKSKDKNADYVIWEGKDGFEWECPISVKHPYCRGTWQRYDIGLDNINIDALVAEQSKNAKKWNNAVKQATKEFEEKGVKNPDDSTKGFTDRIQEIFNSEDVQKSLDGEKDNHTRHYFSESELRKRGEELIKIYEQICKDTGLDMTTVVNKYRITKDGCYYDIENPTEKFYYDLKTKFDEAELVEKSAKYIKRWFSNGEWHYKYPPKYKANQNRTETKKDIAQSTKLITGIEPLEAKTEKDIDDAIVQLALYANEHELKCAALGNHRIYITGRTQEHIKETHNEPRTYAEMKHKAKYIPFVPEILKHGKICEKSSSKEGVIYGIIGQVKYFDKKKNKNVIESVELAINYDKDSRKFVFSFADKSIKKSLLNNRDFDTFSVCPIVDTETVPITVYSLSETPILSSGTVNKSMFTDWKVELHHLCEEKGLDYDSIIQKYDDKLTRFVAEEQLGQDAENVIAYKAYKDLNKSLTWSGHKLQGRTTFNGLNISIENKKGSIRRGVDSDGHKWAIKMNYDYGYIRGTEGVDGDHVDCYLGGNENAKNVYIIHQKIPGTDKYDEDKCMLGFDTLADAKAAYLKQYDKPGFFGGVDTVPFEVFKQKVLLKKWHGKKLVFK